MQDNGPIIDSQMPGISKVFSTIRQTAPVPRIDIAKVTGLSPASVTSITAALMAKGLIEDIPAEARQSGAMRGRPRVNLKIRGDAHLVAGMKLSDKSITVTILDFEGNCLADFSRPTDAITKTAAAAVETLKETLVLALNKAKLSLADISGVGVGLPGIVDAVAGYVHWSPTLTERDIPLRDMLVAALNIPVFLDNDANLVAIAEQRFGMGKKARNFVVITVEQGVGLGIIIDGKIYRGNRGGGAELGHTKVHLDGALCRCGQRGCLEAYVGDYALLREASTTMGNVTGASAEDQMQALFAAARSGDVLAEAIVSRAGRMFAMGLANMVNIFAPELIILSGARMQYDYLYGQKVIEDMKASIVQAGAGPPEVRVHEWGDQMWAMGAAAFAIDGIADLALQEIRFNGV